MSDTNNTSRVALVTGASRGIGASIAAELARRGYQVVGTATTEEGAARITAALAAFPGCRGAKLDVNDAAGVDAAIVQDVDTRAVLMLAWMNAEALDRTLATGEAHYWSRSRQELWHKGATSGQIQQVAEIRRVHDVQTRATPPVASMRGPHCSPIRRPSAIPVAVTAAVLAGLLWLVTGGLFLIGWLYDFWTLNGQVDVINRRERIRG